MPAVNQTLMRRTAWVSAGVLGLPPLLVGWLFVIGVPLTMITFAMGLLAGRSAFWNGLWLCVFVAAVTFVFTIGVVAAAFDGDLILAVAWILCIACAFAATYKLGNIVRLRALDPRS